jgi:hypothetical protein
LSDSSVRNVLDKIVSQNPIYLLQTLNHHLILYPNFPKYHFVVKGIDVINISRIDAAIKYVSHLRRQFPEFADLIVLPALGNPQSFVFTDQMSLEEEMTVIEGFSQLLGDEKSVVFSIIKAKSGVPIFALESFK